MSTTIAQAAELVDRAARDPEFRRRLLDAPEATLQGEGIDVPAGSRVQVLENTAGLRHLVLPGKPEELADDELPPPSATSGAATSTGEKLAAHARLVVDTWSDGDLKARLLSDPATVLAERGIALPPGQAVRVVEAADGIVYLTLPPAAAR